MRSSQRRPITRAHRLVHDERGLGVVEYIVMLVLVVALGVALWNLFGNDVSCRFADAVDTFDSAKPSVAAQCREVTTSGVSAGRAASGSGSPKGRTGGSGASGKATGQSASTSANTAAAAPNPGVPPVPAQPASAPIASTHAPSSGSSAPAERGAADRIGDALAHVGEQAVDFTEGALAGMFPLSPAIPPGQLKPTFGHEISYGVGQTLGSLGGLVYDGVQILGGGATAISAATLIVASDGAALPVAGPALVAATGQVAAGSAMSVGHLGNLKGGINHMMNGGEPSPRPHESGSAGGGESSASSAEKPHANTEKPPANTEKPHAEHEPAMGEQPSAPHEGSAAPAGKTSPLNPVEPAELGVTVRPDGKEVYYRAMSQKDFSVLEKTGKMPPTGETSTSPTRAFSEKYDGVLVEFEMKPGTTAKLQEVGVSDGSPLTKEKLSGMKLGSDVKQWPQNYARFKQEGQQINVQLGKGPGVNVFNSNIDSFHVIPR